MGTKIRNEISKKKEYWIPKHRHLELVHFCLQYPDWKEKLRTIDGYSRKSSSIVSIPEKDGSVAKPIERIIDERLYFKDRIEMVELAAKEAGTELYDYLLKGVTENVG